MQLHQVLTGSCNKNEQCLSSGSFQNVSFVAYASGCDLVILDGDFNRVQVIHGVTNGNIQISAVNAAEETGRIATSYGKTICIYDCDLFGTQDEEVDVEDIYSQSVGLRLGPNQRCRWFLSARIEARGFVYDIAWAPIGDGLLSAGQWLQLWQPKTHPPVFSLGILEEVEGSPQKVAERANTNEIQWTECWSFNYDRVQIDNNVSVTVNSMLSRKASLSGAGTSLKQDEHAAGIAARRIFFSADGSMFATLSCSVIPQTKPSIISSSSNNLCSSSGATYCALVWYRERLPAAFALATSNQGTVRAEALNYRYLVLRHPAPVIACSWRRTSRYMPEGCVSNVLLTSCKDQVCRIWCESRAHLQQGFCSVQVDLSLQPSLSQPQASRSSTQLAPSITTPITTFANEFRSGFLKHLDRLKASKQGSDDSLDSVYSQSLKSSNEKRPSNVDQVSSTVWHHSQAYPHFAMVATINANTDIPLPPTVGHSSNTTSKYGENDFVLHWLHNKEMYFTAETERIVDEMSSNVTRLVNDESKKLAAATVLSKDGSTEKSMSLDNPELVLQKELSKLDVKLDQMLSDWSRSPDVLFLIRPIDGSLLVWMVHWLDESAAVLFDGSGIPSGFGNGLSLGGGSASCRLRHVQVSVHSRLPNAMPLADANTLGGNVLLYTSAPRRICAATRLVNQLQYERERWTRLRQETEQAEWLTSEAQIPSEELGDKIDKSSATAPNVDTESFMSGGNSGIVLVTHHNNGTLNQWHVNLSSTAIPVKGSALNNLKGSLSMAMNNITSVALSVTHGARISGHRFHTNSAVCHPQLPLLLTTSHHNEIPELQQQQLQALSRVEDTSELIMWRVDAVGPLSHAPGITEMARINSVKRTAFSTVAWFPTLLPSYILGIDGNSPAALFLASMPANDLKGPQVPSPSTGDDLRLYLAIIDASHLFDKGRVYTDSMSTTRLEVPSTPSGGHLLGDYPIVSLQSTANPGCFVELDSLSELVTKTQNLERARCGGVPDMEKHSHLPHTLRNYIKSLDSCVHHIKTLLLHVFTEEMVMSASHSGMCIPLTTTSNDVDAPHKAGSTSGSTFNEFHYVIRLLQVTSRAAAGTLHKMKDSSCSSRVTVWMQMWRVHITGNNRTKNLSGDNARPRTNAISESSTNVHFGEDNENLTAPESTRRSRRVSFTLDDTYHEGATYKAGSQEPKLSCTTHDLGIHAMCQKVCEQNLSELLPESCKVLHANVAAGHLSSANIYPACFSPYLIATACSDGIVRFWKCHTDNQPSFQWIEWPLLNDGEQSSQLLPPVGISGKPRYISCAYSGRVAVAYEMFLDEPNITKDTQEELTASRKQPLRLSRAQGTQYMHLCVGIFECESTGGAGWVLEDMLELGQVKVPESVLSTSDWPLNHLNIAPSAVPEGGRIPLSQLGRSKTVDEGRRPFITSNKNESMDRGDLSMEFSSMSNTGRAHFHAQQSVYYDDFEEHLISDKTSNQNLPLSHAHHVHWNNSGSQSHTVPSVEVHHLRLKPKRIVQLDWVSTEDGSHMLSVAVGTQILIYAPVCRELVLATSSRTTRRTLMTSRSHQEVHWLKLRVINLASADDLPPFPLHCSWVREGLLVVGLDNELHVYSQWRSQAHHRLDSLDFKHMLEESGDLGKDLFIASLPPGKGPNGQQGPETHASDESVHLLNSIAVPTASMTMARLTKTYSTFGLSKTSSAHNLINNVAGGATGSQTAVIAPSSDIIGAINFVAFIRDIGLFEAVQVCNPILPQYHPRQLMEWLNFGKLRRVKAILAHLTRCVAPPSRRYKGKNTSLMSDGWHGSSSSSCDESNSDASDDYLNDITGGVNSAELERIHKGTLKRSLTVKSAAGGGSSSENSGWSTIRAIPPLPLYVLLALDNAASSTKPTALKDTDKAKKAAEDEFAFLNEETTNYAVSGSEDSDDEFKSKSRNQRRQSLRRLKRQRMSSTSEKLSSVLDLCNFTTRHAAKLSERLARLQLPGLSALDQMYLLGIAELMANTRSEVTERLSQLGGVSGTQALGVSSQTLGSTLGRMKMGGGFGGYASPEGSLMGTTDSLDNCGLRFLLAMQHHSYMLRTLPIQQRQVLQTRGMSTADIVWAFHSEAEEELLSRLPCMAQDQLSWLDFRQYGCSWWIRNDNTLRRCIEKIAKTAFQATRDPMDAAIFYLAMKKPKIVAGLFKTGDNRTLEEFFRSDFTDQAACRKAKVNAFNLLSKRRFQHAAALFLLAGSLSDALQVCLHNLHDLQLALTIARLYETSMESGGMSMGLVVSTPMSAGSNLTQVLEKLWRERVVTSLDPFLRSMGHWTLGEHDQALSTLVQSDSPFSTVSSPASSTLASPRGSIATTSIPLSPSSANPPGAADLHRQDYQFSIFHFYIFLRQHPLLMRLRSVKHKGRVELGIMSSLSTPDQSAVKQAIPRISSAAERRLYFQTAYRYNQIGCPALALEVLSQLPQRMGQEVVDHDETDDVKLNPTGAIPSDQDDVTFNWSSFTTDEQVKSVEDDFKIEFSDDEDDASDDSEKPPKNIKASIPLIQTEPNTLSVEDSVEKSKEESYKKPVDVMAQQLKFVACLKLMCEELSTLATGIEPNGAHLRYHFYQWLEREVIVLQQICSYQTHALPPVESIANQLATLEGKKTGSARVRHLSTSGLLAPLIPGSIAANEGENVRESGTIQSRSGSETELRLTLFESRKAWLLTHQALLHSLASFCSLQGASGVGLASLRMELLLLLQELHQQQEIKGNLQAKLPPSVHLPLISSVLSPIRTVLANPIQHIRFLVRDVMDTVSNLHLPHTNITMKSNNEYIKSVEHTVLLLRNLSIALSACIYQGLSESKSLAAMFLRQAGIVDSSGSVNFDKEKPEMTVLENLTTHFLRTMNNVVYSDGCELLLRRRRMSTSETQQSNNENLPNSDPKKWPGTMSVLTLLTGGSMRSNVHEQASKLAPFLCEVLVAVYLGLLVFSLHSCDTGILYRLTAHSLDGKFWARVFGGVLRKPTTASNASTGTGGSKPGRPPPPTIVTPSSPRPSPSVSMPPANTMLSPSQQPNSRGITIIHPSHNRPSSPRLGGDLSASVGTPLDNSIVDSQRMRFINRVAPPRPDKPIVDETFVQPQLSIVSALMEKPMIESTSSNVDFNYDSTDDEHTDMNEGNKNMDDDEEDDSDTEGDTSAGKTQKRAALPQNVELMNPSSFSWHLLRLAVLHRALERIQHLMHLLGLEPSEIGSSCSHLFECIKRIRIWQQQCIQGLQSQQCPVPPHFLERLQLSMQHSGNINEATISRAVQRYRALLNRDNTPFDPIKLPEALAAKRLWCYLVRQDSLHDIFMRYVYAKVKPAPDNNVSQTDSKTMGVDFSNRLSSTGSTSVVKIIHKEQDPLYGLCINQANLNCIAVCTAKDVVEVDISNLVNPPTWLEDDIEYDIEVIRNPPGDQKFSDDFVLLERQSVSGPSGGGSNSMGMTASSLATHYVPSAPGVLPAPRDVVYQSGSHSTNVTQKRPLSNVMKMASHPSLPYYMCVTSGTQIYMYEWDSKQPVVNAFNSPCHKGKLQALRFDSNGRKFGVGDSEGIFALWHLSLAANMSAPYFVCRAHRRGISDFTFLQSASVLCTAGIPLTPSGVGGSSMVASVGGSAGGGGSSGTNVGTSFDCGPDVSLAVWDTLMPTGRNAVQQYNDQVLSGGCTAVTTIGQQHSLLVGTKKGELVFIDLRQGSIRHSFLAHDGAIKSLVVDPQHHFCATGGADGAIKIWRLGGHELLGSFRGEHTRGGASALFRQSDFGTTQLCLLPEVQLISCGGDGSIRMRNLADLL